MYDKRVKPVVSGKCDYFHHELVNTLAEGDAAKLGASGHDSDGKAGRVIFHFQLSFVIVIHHRALKRRSGREEWFFQ
jgi:hypothetical protein